MLDLQGARPLRSVAWTRMRNLAVTAALGAGAALVATGTGGAPGAAAPAAAGASGRAADYIVQAGSSGAAGAAVAALHGAVLTSLPVVEGVVARLTPAEAATARRDGLRVSPDLAVDVQGSSAVPLASHPSGVFTSVTGATSMWANGITGAGVTVAVLDTGIDNLPDLRGRLIGGVDLAGDGSSWAWDGYGHGTFVAGLIASDGASSGGQYMGEAPGADLVSIKVAGFTGATTEGTVIEGVEWAIDHRQQYGIRVLNLSLGTEPPSPSALDPLDEVVEDAWQSGIVVVVSAGNQGPANGTITSPGNDPLAITVGALNDGASTNPAAFSIPSFSSVGPTLWDGWFKPDIVAPGVSVVSLDAPGSLVDSLNPQAHVGSANFVGSGTSFSAAIVSGMVALLLQAHPSLTPDEVKAALLDSAEPGPAGDPFVDGHGIADAPAASAVAGRVFLDQWPAADAESSSPPATVPLASTWAVSTWNPANWSGPAFSAPATGGATAVVHGAAWNGAAWNGAAWNGAAWNGAEWNGAEWNGAEWNSSVFDDEYWG